MLKLEVIRTVLVCPISVAFHPKVLLVVLGMTTATCLAWEAYILETSNLLSL